MTLNDKYLFVFLSAVLFLHGCTSPYKPSAQALQMSRQMSDKQAMQVLKGAMINRKSKVLGLCYGYGIHGAGMLSSEWEVNETNPGLKINKNGFNLNAYMISKSVSTSGYVSAPVSTINQSRSPIHMKVNFADIESIRLTNTSGALTRVCYRKDGQTEVMAFLDTGTGHAFGLVVEDQKVDQLVAAFMILAPKAKLETR